MEISKEVNMAQTNPTDVLIDDAVEKVQSTVSRSVVTKLVPFLTLVLVPVVAWLQAKVGIDLDSTQLAVYIGTAVLGIAGVAFGYVRERLKGIYGLHQTLIDQGINVYEQGTVEYKEETEVPLPPGV